MMVVLLLLLGFIAVAAGVFLVGVGVPAKDTTFGAALLVSASVAITGGFILVGLAAAVSALQRALQNGTRYMRPERWQAERGPGTRRMEPRLAAAGPSGGTLAGALNGGGIHAGPASPDAADVIPTKFDTPEAIERPRRPVREDWPAADAGNVRAPSPDAAGEPRRAQAPSPSRFDAIRPADYRKPDQNKPELQETKLHADAPLPDGTDDGAARPSPAPDETAEPGAIRPVRVLKSGMINDVSYTLFSDGSIETQTPDGTKRFGSIDEFRKHLESSP